MAVAPIDGPGGSLVGLLYLDSFADSRQSFVKEDLQILEQTARLLGGTFQ